MAKRQLQCHRLIREYGVRLTVGMHAIPCLLHGLTPAQLKSLHLSDPELTEFISRGLGC
jgi:hypothetical protein